MFCLLCNLVHFGLHFLKTFSEANIYEYLSSIIIWGLFADFSACGRFFLYLWGSFFGFPPPPLRTKLSVCAHEYMVLLRTIDRGMGAYAPPKILIKLHVWSIYNLIRFPHLLSIRGACTPKKLFLSGTI